MTRWRPGHRGARAQIDVAATVLHPGEHDVLGQYGQQRVVVRRIEAQRHHRQVDLDSDRGSGRIAHCDSLDSYISFGDIFAGFGGSG